VSPNLDRSSRKARAHPDRVLTSLYHHIAAIDHILHLLRALRRRQGACQRVLASSTGGYGESAQDRKIQVTLCTDNLSLCDTLSPLARAAGSHDADLCEHYCTRPCAWHTLPPERHASCERQGCVERLNTSCRRIGRHSLLVDMLQLLGKEQAALAGLLRSIPDVQK
jgi:hypothetical protein